MEILKLHFKLLCQPIEHTIANYVNWKSTWELIYLFAIQTDGLVSNNQDTLRSHCCGSKVMSRADPVLCF